ncbi:MAG: hypothetical protein JJU40_16665 [Rhodobacteraceae bacterium]|nr:hypothetical protein [Paracoccaceae bacterium]
MNNVIGSVASSAPIIETESQNGNLRVIAVQGEGFDALAKIPEFKQPGVYVCVGSKNQLYVGYSGKLIVRTHRFAATPERPPFLMAIVGNKTPLEPYKASMLERIAHQALMSAGHSVVNERGPYGKVINPDVYSTLQNDWASILRPISQVVPALACPWIEPDYAKVPKPHPEDVYLEQFLAAEKCGIRAEIKRVYGGYVILPGSMVRRDPVDSARDVCHITRIESRYCGLLVPDHGELRLTRPVFRPSLTSCSKLVFTTGETAIWEPIREQLPPSAA